MKLTHKEFASGWLSTRAITNERGFKVGEITREELTVKRAAGVKRFWIKVTDKRGRVVYIGGNPQQGIAALAALLGGK